MAKGVDPIVRALLDLSLYGSEDCCVLHGEFDVHVNDLVAESG